MENLSPSSSHDLKHVAIIMDGNNRWAKNNKKGGIAGHKAGVERIRDVLSACRKQGVTALTLFAFSSENWRRPPKEVEALMGLFYSYLKKEAKKLASENVAIKVIGRRDRFSDRLKKAIDEAEAVASTGDATLVIAADYGGCWDIANAAKQAARSVSNIDDIDEALISQFTQTAGLPPLDLLIRTGGELRISNFLLWQAAYAELYFSEALWPDFDDAELNNAIKAFYSRQRRFGKTGEQLEQDAINA